MGPDLDRAVLGSGSRIGLPIQFRLRVWPRPAWQFLGGCSCRDLDAGLKFMQRIKDAGLYPGWWAIWSDNQSIRLSFEFMERTENPTYKARLADLGLDVDWQADSDERFKSRFFGTKNTVSSKHTHHTWRSRTAYGEAVAKGGVVWDLDHDAVLVSGTDEMAVENDWSQLTSTFYSCFDTGDTSMTTPTLQDLKTP